MGQAPVSACNPVFGCPSRLLVLSHAASRAQEVWGVSLDSLP